MPTSPQNHDSAGDPRDPSGDSLGGGYGPKSTLIPERCLPQLGGEDAGLAGDGQTPTPEELTAIARGQVVAAWLQRMAREDVPSSLDGLVVAAMNPGLRQTRAARTVSSLTRLDVPVALDVRVEGLVLGEEQAPLEPAPAELDQLVEDRVEEPAAGLVKGMAKRLDTVPAPDELESRVEQQLVFGSHPGPIRRHRWLNRSMGAVGMGAALAAALLLFSRVGQEAAPKPAPLDGVSDSVLVTASGLSFNVEYLDSRSMSASDHAVLKTMGLPSVGGS